MMDRATMPRKVDEWMGRSDDAMPPRSVFDRLWEKQGGKDAITGVPFTSKDKIVRDHIVPLADGGENRESNLQLITAQSHKPKTAAEATARAKTRRIHERDRGYERQVSRLQGRPFNPAPKQSRATTPITGKFPGDIMGNPNRYLEDEGVTSDRG